MRLVLISLLAWMGGSVGYVVAARQPFDLGLLIYGAVFSALPSFVVFGLILLPSFAWLRRRSTPGLLFPALSTAICLFVAVTLNTVPRTSSGPTSSEALIFYVAFGVVGVVLGLGYWYIMRSDA